MSLKKKYAQFFISLSLNLLLLFKLYCQYEFDNDVVL